MLANWKKAQEVFRERNKKEKNLDRRHSGRFCMPARASLPCPSCRRGCNWLTAMNAKVDAQTLIENLESEIEGLQDSIEEQNAEMEDLNAQLTQAQKELETGTIEAESLRQTRKINLESAEEIYSVKTQLAQADTQNALEDYEEAQERMSKLDTYLANGQICALDSGVITDVTIGAGDGLEEGSELISINDYEDVTITVTLEETEMELAFLEAKAEISFSAFPDEIFQGEVTKIGDAQIDSNTNRTTYEVVVTVLENGSRLYEGMSAEVTFIRTQEEVTE